MRHEFPPAQLRNNWLHRYTLRSRDHDDHDEEVEVLVDGEATLDKRIPGPVNAQSGEDDRRRAYEYDSQENAGGRHSSLYHREQIRWVGQVRADRSSASQPPAEML